MTTTNALIAPMDGSTTEPELSSPPTVTEQEIGDFREQDRVLPVSIAWHCRRWPPILANAKITGSK